MAGQPCGVRHVAGMTTLACATWLTRLWFCHVADTTVVGHAMWLMTPPQAEPLADTIMACATWLLHHCQSLIVAVTMTPSRHTTDATL